jgi:hypothetical protein
MKTDLASNESLLQALHEAAKLAGYYTAAEGRNYTDEEPLRARAWARWYTLVEIARQRGVYLEEDYKRYFP